MYKLIYANLSRSRHYINSFTKSYKRVIQNQKINLPKIEKEVKSKSQTNLCAKKPSPVKKILSDSGICKSEIKLLRCASGNKPILLPNKSKPKISLVTYSTNPRKLFYSSLANNSKYGTCTPKKKSFLNKEAVEYYKNALNQCNRIKFKRLLENTVYQPRTQAKVPSSREERETNFQTSEIEHKSKAVRNAKRKIKFMPIKVETGPRLKIRKNPKLPAIHNLDPPKVIIRKCKKPKKPVELKQKISFLDRFYNKSSDTSKKEANNQQLSQETPKIKVSTIHKKVQSKKTKLNQFVINHVIRRRPPSDVNIKGEQPIKFRYDLVEKDRIKPKILCQVVQKPEKKNPKPVTKISYPVNSHIRQFNPNVRPNVVRYLQRYQSPLQRILSSKASEHKGVQTEEQKSEDDLSTSNKCNNNKDQIVNKINKHPTIQTMSKEARMNLKKSYMKLLSSRKPTSKIATILQRSAQQSRPEVVPKETQSTNDEKSTKLTEDPPPEDPEVVVIDLDGTEIESKITKHPSNLKKSDSGNDIKIKYPKKVLSDALPTFNIDETCMKMNSGPKTTVIDNYVPTRGIEEEKTVDSKEIKSIEPPTAKRDDFLKKIDKEIDKAYKDQHKNQDERPQLFRQLLYHYQKLDTEVTSKLKERNASATSAVIRRMSMKPGTTIKPEIKSVSLDRKPKVQPCEIKPKMRTGVSLDRKMVAKGSKLEVTTIKPVEGKKSYKLENYDDTARKKMAELGSKLQVIATKAVKNNEQNIGNQLKQIRQVGDIKWPSLSREERKLYEDLLKKKIVQEAAKPNVNPEKSEDPKKNEIVPKAEDFEETISGEIKANIMRINEKKGYIPAPIHPTELDSVEQKREPEKIQQETKLASPKIVWPRVQEVEKNFSQGFKEKISEEVKSRVKDVVVQKSVENIAKKQNQPEFIQASLVNVKAIKKMTQTCLSEVHKVLTESSQEAQIKKPISELKKQKIVEEKEKNKNNIQKLSVESTENKNCDTKSPQISVRRVRKKHKEPMCGYQLKIVQVENVGLKLFKESINKLKNSLEKESLTSKTSNDLNNTSYEKQDKIQHADNENNKLEATLSTSKSDSAIKTNSIQKMQSNEVLTKSSTSKPNLSYHLSGNISKSNSSSSIKNTNSVQKVDFKPTKSDTKLMKSSSDTVQKKKPSGVTIIQIKKDANKDDIKPIDTKRKEKTDETDNKYTISELKSSKSEVNITKAIMPEKISKCASSTKLPAEIISSASTSNMNKNVKLMPQESEKDKLKPEPILKNPVLEPKRITESSVESTKLEEQSKMNLEQKTSQSVLNKLMAKNSVTETKISENKKVQNVSKIPKLLLNDSKNEIKKNIAQKNVVEKEKVTSNNYNKLSEQCTSKTSVTSVRSTKSASEFKEDKNKIKPIRSKSHSNIIEKDMTMKDISVKMAANKQFLTTTKNIFNENDNKLTLSSEQRKLKVGKEIRTPRAKIDTYKKLNDNKKLATQVEDISKKSDTKDKHVQELFNNAKSKKTATSSDESKKVCCVLYQRVDELNKQPKGESTTKNSTGDLKNKDQSNSKNLKVPLEATTTNISKEKNNIKSMKLEPKELSEDKSNKPTISDTSKHKQSKIPISKNEQSPLEVKQTLMSKLSAQKLPQKPPEDAKFNSKFKEFLFKQYPLIKSSSCKVQQKLDVKSSDSYKRVVKKIDQKAMSSKSVQDSSVRFKKDLRNKHSAVMASKSTVIKTKHANDVTVKENITVRVNINKNEEAFEKTKEKIKEHLKKNQENQLSVVLQNKTLNKKEKINLVSAQVLSEKIKKQTNVPKNTGTSKKEEIGSKYKDYKKKNEDHKSHWLKDINKNEYQYQQSFGSVKNEKIEPSNSISNKNVQSSKIEDTKQSRSIDSFFKKCEANSSKDDNKSNTMNSLIISNNEKFLKSDKMKKSGRTIKNDVIEENKKLINTNKSKETFLKIGDKQETNTNNNNVSRISKEDTKLDASNIKMKKIDVDSSKQLSENKTVKKEIISTSKSQQNIKNPVKSSISKQNIVKTSSKKIKDEDTDSVNAGNKQYIPPPPKQPPATEKIDKIKKERPKTNKDMVLPPRNSHMDSIVPPKSSGSDEKKAESAVKKIETNIAQDTDTSPFSTINYKKLSEEVYRRAKNYIFSLSTMTLSDNESSKDVTNVKSDKSKESVVEIMTKKVDKVKSDPGVTGPDVTNKKSDINVDTISGTNQDTKEVSIGEKKIKKIEIRPRAKKSRGYFKPKLAVQRVNSLPNVKKINASKRGNIMNNMVRASDSTIDNKNKESDKKIDGSEAKDGKLEKEKKGNLQLSNKQEIDFLRKLQRHKYRESPRSIEDFEKCASFNIKLGGRFELTSDSHLTTRTGNLDTNFKIPQYTKTCESWWSKSTPKVTDMQPVNEVFTKEVRTISLEKSKSSKLRAVFKIKQSGEYELLDTDDYQEFTEPTEEAFKKIKNVKTEPKVSNSKYCLENYKGDLKGSKQVKRSNSKYLLEDFKGDLRKHSSKEIKNSRKKSRDNFVKLGKEQNIDSSKNLKATICEIMKKPEKIPKRKPIITIKSDFSVSPDNTYSDFSFFMNPFAEKTQIYNELLLTEKENIYKKFNKNLDFVAPSSKNDLFSGAALGPKVDTKKRIVKKHVLSDSEVANIKNNSPDVPDSYISIYENKILKPRLIVNVKLPKVEVNDQIIAPKLEENNKEVKVLHKPKDKPMRGGISSQVNKKILQNSNNNKNRTDKKRKHTKSTDSDKNEDYVPRRKRVMETYTKQAKILTPSEKIENKKIFKENSFVSNVTKEADKISTTENRSLTTAIKKELEKRKSEIKLRKIDVKKQLSIIKQQVMMRENQIAAKCDKIKSKENVKKDGIDEKKSKILNTNIKLSTQGIVENEKILNKNTKFKKVADTLKTVLYGEEGMKEMSKSKSKTLNTLKQVLYGQLTKIDTKKSKTNTLKSSKSILRKLLEENNESSAIYAIKKILYGESFMKELKNQNASKYNLEKCIVENKRSSIFPRCAKSSSDICRICMPSKSLIKLLEPDPIEAKSTYDVAVGNKPNLPKVKEDNLSKYRHLKITYMKVKSKNKVELPDLPALVIKKPVHIPYDKKVPPQVRKSLSEEDIKVLTMRFEILRRLYDEFSKQTMVEYDKEIEKKSLKGQGRKHSKKKLLKPADKNNNNKPQARKLSTDVGIRSDFDIEQDAPHVFEKGTEDPKTDDKYKNYLYYKYGRLSYYDMYDYLSKLRTYSQPKSSTTGKSSKTDGC